MCDFERWIYQSLPLKNLLKYLGNFHTISNSNINGDFLPSWVSKYSIPNTH